MSSPPPVDGPATGDRQAADPAKPAEATPWADRARLMPRVHVTWAMIAANLVVGAVMLGGGVDAFQPTAERLLPWGANYGPLVGTGQWWRLLTAMFVHIGVIHLAVNMYALWKIGPLTERIFGHGLYAAIYVGAGLWASVTSVLWNPEICSAGASGAIFGVYGAAFGYTARYRRAIPAQLLKQQRGGIVTFLASNLLVAFHSNVDSAAHVGGLAVGLLAGVLLGRPLEVPPRDPARLRALRVAIIAGALSPLVAMFALPHRAAYALAATAFYDMETRVLGLLNSATDKYQKGHMDKRTFIGVLTNEVLPPWRAGRERLAHLRALSPRQRKLADLTIRYATERQTGWEQSVLAVEADDQAVAEKAAAHQAAADALVKQIEAAVKE